jgi:hypothetical protein
MQKAPDGFKPSDAFINFFKHKTRIMKMLFLLLLYYNKIFL